MVFVSDKILPKKLYANCPKSGLNSFTILNKFLLAICENIKR